MLPFNEKNVPFQGAENRTSVYDIAIPEAWNGKIILFVHGYMGFKDWGCWNLVGEFFVKHNYGFVKYNVSHNGGTLDNPIAFTDTEAFSKNNYSKELEDFEQIARTLEDRLGSLTLLPIGHSRGGGIVALQSKHPAVKKWVSWAGISSISTRFPEGEALELWRKNTYRYVKNGRTLQELPHHFEQYLDFKKNAERLDIERACKENTKPCLIVHGTEDSSVDISEGESLATWTKTPLLRIPAAQHTFNSVHPWESIEMPNALETLCYETLLFFDV